MTEDIKRRLEFDNPSIKIQAVGKLLDQVIAKKQADSKISNSTPEIAELRLLHERCLDACPVVAAACCDALVSLVRQGHAEYGFILRNLLNIVPSARQLCGIVKSISELLTLQVLSDVQQTGRYETPYSTRSAPHPFITILTSRNDVWPYLLEQVIAIATHPHENVESSSVEMLRPFLHFVFLDPSWRSEFAHLRRGLQGALMYGSPEWPHPITLSASRISQITFLVDIIPCLQVEAVNYGEVVQYLRDLLQYLIIPPSNGDLEEVMGRLAGYTLSICCRLCHLGLSVTSLLHSLVNMQKTYPKSLHNSVDILLLADLSSHCQLCDQNTVLTLGESMLEFGLSSGATIWANLTIPLLQIIALPVSTHTESKPNKVLATRLLQHILSEAKYSSEDVPQKPFAITPNCKDYILQNYAMLAKTGLCVKRDQKNWLQSIQTELGTNQKVPGQVTRMVVSLLVTDTEGDVIGQCLEVLISIAKGNPGQAGDMVAVLLFKMNRVTDPEAKHLLLSALPRMATHKICTGPILKIIQVLSVNPKLHAFSIRLMTSLWKQQDRCFPHLQQLLLQNEAGSKVNPLELKLAKAASIQEICILRPHQHGADMLPLLSELLTSSTSAQEASVAALALDGLHALCAEEVVDIRTVWVVLSEKLQADKRTQVICHVCKLLSLVPELRVNTEEYETFMKEVVQLLWQHVMQDNPEVTTAALEALSTFPVEAFSIHHLPISVCEDILRTLEISKTDQAEEIDEEAATMKVPGMCYVKLLQCLQKKSFAGCESFLSSLVRQEVAALPRGIHHTAVRRNTGATAQNKALLAIPAQLLEKYQQNRQPGLRAGYAAALLFCFDPQIPVGQDGRPRKQHLVSHGRQYQDMLNTLITEVQWDPSDWYRMMMQAQAWLAFVGRCYTACIDCRDCETDMQLRHGHLEDAEEARIRRQTAWVWVRDQLTDLIKKTSRGSPSVQANSLLALAALAVHSSRHSDSLDQDALKALRETPEHLSQAHWLNIVTDTFMAILDVTFEPQGKILAVCQQRIDGGRTPASLLARSASCLSLAQIVPILVTSDTDRIYSILDLMTPGLPGHPRADQSSILQFHCGLGLGMFIGRLFEERFSDIAGMQGMVAVWKAVDILESCCFDETLEHRSGCVLGLGLCTSSMCLDSSTDTRVHVKAVHGKLLQLLEATEDSSSALGQSICTSLSGITVNAYVVNIIDQSEVDTVVSQLSEIHNQSPYVPGLCLAVGGLCSNLEKCGHPSVRQHSDTLSTAWLGLLCNQDAATVVKLSSLSGLIALSGSEQQSIMTQHESGLSTDSGASSVNMTDLIKATTQLLPPVGRDLNLQNNSAWLLGHLYASTCVVSSGSRASVPVNYSYLPESSVIRAIVEELLKASRNGPEVVDPDCLLLMLNSLLRGPEQVLPPVNWAGVLSPFMKLGFGEAVQPVCLELALKQLTKAPSAGMFITPWLVAPLFNTLNRECKTLQFESMPDFAKSVPASKLRDFLEKSCMQPFQKDHLDAGLCVAVLRGLKEALSTKDLPQAVTLLLYQCLERSYLAIMTSSHTVEAGELLVAVSECLALVPDSVVDRITQNDFAEHRDSLKTLFVRCYLIGHGKQPIEWLSPCVEYILQIKEIDIDRVAQIIGTGLYHMTITNSEYTEVSPRQQWLLQLMSHVKNVASQDHAPQNTQMVRCAVLVFAAAVVSWSGLPHADLCSVQPLLFISADRHPNHSADRALTVMPQAVVNLLNLSPWKQISSKMIDWLQTMYTLVQQQSLRKVFKGCILALRYTGEFQKVDTWTRVYSSIAVETKS